MDYILLFWEPLTFSRPTPKPLVLEFVETVPRGSLLLFGFGLIAMFVKPVAQLCWFAVPVVLSNGLLTLAHLQGDLETIGGMIALVTVMTALAATIAALILSRAAWQTGLLFTTACLPMIASQGLLSVIVLSGSTI